MRTVSHRNYFLPVMGLLIVLAWTTLWIWERSPYGRYLNHDELGTLDLFGDAGGVMLAALLYIAGWTLMTVAMMLPTTVPLLEIFRRLTRRRSDHGLLVALVIAGYLSVWLAFGIAVHLADWVLHEVFERSAWLEGNGWLIGAGTLLLAGAFQFSRLKYACLEKCRAPLTFVMEHWRGRNERTHSFLLGVHHGVFCVGCCWALMLLMFGVGIGNVGWMLALGAVMAVEKNVAWGRKLSAPLGVGLLAWGVLITIARSEPWIGL